MKNREVQYANQVVEICESTNDLAKKLAQNAVAHGTWVSALEQTQGRGRLGRVWQSKPGNLFLSMIARELDRSLWSWAPLAVGLAVLDCLQETEIQIKWPNDLIYKGRKLAGILCEGNSDYLIIGLGLNCKKANDFPDAATLEEIKQTEINLDLLRMTIINGILRRLKMLQIEKTEKIILDYEQHSLLKKGMQIEWGAETREQGIVLGLGSQGELLALVGQNGEVKKLFAEEVSIRK